MSPFDKARYERLLKGLEVAERRLSELERTGRIDAEFFQHRHLEIEKKLAAARCESVARVALVSDGNHFAISESFVDEGVPYYRGQDAVGHFFIEQANPNKITRAAFDQPYMRRSHLKQGDVLLSIIGTVGETSLVKTAQDATCSCKLAILRSNGIEPAYLATYLSSVIGRSLTEQWKRGAVQTGLLLEDMDQIPIPRFKNGLEERIAQVVELAYQSLETSKRNAELAETTLLRVLGLENWRPPEPLSYERSSGQVARADRLDSEYHQPKYEVLYAELSSRFSFRSLASLGQVTKGVTVPYFEDGDVPIIRSGDLGRIDNEGAFLRSKSSEPVFYLQKGDVLISSIGFGSIGKVEVFEKEGRFGAVSEVTVIRQEQINAHYLAAFLRSEAGRMQIERHIRGATGQLHLYSRDVANFWVPVLPELKQLEFETLAKRAHSKKVGASQLLNVAKRAVEIAIEESEGVALDYLAGVVREEGPNDEVAGEPHPGIVSA